MDLQCRFWRLSCRDGSCSSEWTADKERGRWAGTCGEALTPHQGAHLCVLACLPHKMAPGSGNGPWKWLLCCAHSTLYGLGFFMWQLGCWDRHPGGCTLIKDSSSGLFCTASCGQWPSFHPWARCYTAALLLALAVTPGNAARGWSHDSSDSWPGWPLETPPFLSASLPRMVAGPRMGHTCPPKMAATSLGFQRKDFLSWRCPS